MDRPNLCISFHTQEFLADLARILDATFVEALLVLAV